jgi:hypothetical protein
MFKEGLPPFLCHWNVLDWWPDAHWISPDVAWLSCYLQINLSVLDDAQCEYPHCFKVCFPSNLQISSKLLMIVDEIHHHSCCFFKIYVKVTCRLFAPPGVPLRSWAIAWPGEARPLGEVATGSFGEREFTTKYAKLSDPHWSIRYLGVYHYKLGWQLWGV